MNSDTEQQLNCIKKIVRTDDRIANRKYAYFEIKTKGIDKTFLLKNQNKIVQCDCKLNAFN